MYKIVLYNSNHIVLDTVYCNCDSRVAALNYLCDTITKNLVLKNYINLATSIDIIYLEVPDEEI